MQHTEHIVAASPYYCSKGTFVYGYSDGLHFGRLKKGESHDWLVCSQYFVG
ncbi:hypothetical protein R6Q59_031175 [Mikania micrantha]